VHYAIYWLVHRIAVCRWRQIGRFNR